MIKLFKLKKSSIMASKRVPEKHRISRWGILSIKNKKKTTFKLRDVIEKPKIKNSPSNFAIIGEIYFIKEKF